MRLPLPLLVLGVGADDADDAAPPYHLALVTNPPHRRSYFHHFLLSLAKLPRHSNTASASRGSVPCPAFAWRDIFLASHIRRTIPPRVRPRDDSSRTTRSPTSSR